MNPRNRWASSLCGRGLWPCLVFLIFLCPQNRTGTARAQSSQPATPPAQAGSQSNTDNASAEISSRDEASTFKVKVNVNLVLVRVVVRDSKGNVIGNLTKDDFELLDNRKPQVITQFSAEQPGTHAVKPPPAPNETIPGEAAPDTSKLPPLPERYIAYVFDDIHLAFGDLAQAREAAYRNLASLRPTDRAAIFSTSGQTTLDFTDDRVKLHDTLNRLLPRPIASAATGACFDVSYYIADLIENHRDTQALGMVTQDVLRCEFNNNSTYLSVAERMADSTAIQVLASGEAESHVALTVLKDVIRRMSVMPGQRSVVLVSPGFLTPQLESEYNDVIDHALHSQITIGAVDARGLYALLPGGDISNPNTPSPQSLARRSLYATSEASANADVLAALADGTGGIFFHNSNDLDAGFQRVASTPEYFYVLGFAPQNIKLDGAFHSLKVRLKNNEKLVLQARRGYFAPKAAADPSQQAKQEIEDALFSQEEIHDLPVDLHTRFFKSSEAAAKLTVLAHVDARRLRFRKVDGRNYDELTVVSALFNRNGGLIQGMEKTLTMRLKDDTLQNSLGSGITLKTSFDVGPGSYMVRLVVRDAERQLLSAENDTVQIP